MFCMEAEMMVTYYCDKHQSKDQSSGRLCTEFNPPNKGP